MDEDQELHGGPVERPAFLMSIPIRPTPSPPAVNSISLPAQQSHPSSIAEVAAGGSGGSNRGLPTEATASSSTNLGGTNEGTTAQSNVADRVESGTIMGFSCGLCTQTFGSKSAKETHIR